MSDLAKKYADNPDIPEHSRNGLMAMNSMRPLAQLNGDATPLIDRLLAGEHPKEIAASYGVSRTAVYNYVLQHAPEMWQQVQTARQLDALDQCEDDLDKPIGDGGEYTSEMARRDGLTITRARERARLSQWHLERANRKLFGDTKHEANQQVIVHVHRDTDSTSVIVQADDES